MAKKSTTKKTTPTQSATGAKSKATTKKPAAKKATSRKAPSAKVAPPSAPKADVASVPAPPMPKTNREPSHDEIAAKAHEIWVAKGFPVGQDEQNWREAEAALRGG